MVTDTAPFRNPNYHQPTDTPDAINYDYLARVTHGLKEVVASLLRGSQFFLLRERPVAVNVDALVGSVSADGAAALVVSGFETRTAGTST